MSKETLDRTSTRAYTLATFPSLGALPPSSDGDRVPELLGDAAFRQALLAFLETERSEALERFEAQGRPPYASLLHLLTHLSFGESRARRHWQRMQAHREVLRQALGRDVGLRVALLDYFVNVNQELKNPKVIEIAIYERTQRSAVTDGLTGLFNHVHLVAGLGRELRRSRRSGLKTSLVILDLDDFKRVNDTRGHLEGDRVLRQAADVLRRNLRDVDLAARYGGEEFAVLLPDTPRMGAFVVAERVRRAIERHFQRRNGGPRVTVSGGVATFPDDADDVEPLLRRADEGLYRSKAAGKNRITLARGERREHPRIPVKHPVTFVTEAGPRSAARARDVSAGGLLVSLRQRVPVGARVSLIVRPPSGRAIGLRGEVVRVTRRSRKALFEVGVRLDTTARGTLSLVKRLSGAA